MTYKDKFLSFDGTNQHFCSETFNDEELETFGDEEKVTSTFEKELEDIMCSVEKSLSDILLSEDRTSKHDPYTWINEDEDEHLRKAARHITTYQIIRDGHQEPDGEDHLNNAITRLAMAIAKQKI